MEERVSTARERELLRSVAALINKEGSEKSVGYEEIRIRMLDDKSLQDKLLVRSDVSRRIVDQTSVILINTFEEKLKKQVLIDLLDNIFESTVKRLTSEIKALGKRSTFNLVLGFSITATALGLLGLIAFNANSNHADLKSALVYFAPRVSITIFIEVFAFFFLRLYRNSLEEIRYYQAQLTQVAKYRIAVTIASLSGEITLQAAVVSALCLGDKDFTPSSEESSPDNDLLKQALNVAQQVAKAATSGKTA